MMSNRFRNVVAGVLLALLIAAPAQAFPPIQNGDGVDDDARIFLSVRDRAIRGDSRPLCGVRIVVTGDERAFADGDEIEVWVLEDDVIGDDTVWETRFGVSPEEIADQRVDRMFDCAAPLDDDVRGGLEIYATAHVSKADCGLLCNEDDPTTRVLPVELVDDDDGEDNDGSGDANGLPLGLLSDRVARDQDWYRVETDERARLRLIVEHPEQEGGIDVALFDGAGRDRIATATDGVDEARVEIEALPAGEYTVRVTPRNGGDYNFYDVRLRLALTPQNCEPDSEQADDCDRCGQRVRVCGAGGEWGEWGACDGAGVCDPGQIRSADCGLCGTRLETCDDRCEWQPDDCGDEGPCLPGAVDEADCDGADGLRTRVCDGQCRWGEYSPCEQSTCDPGEQRACYTGPPELADVGGCERGRQSCVGGRLTSCEGSVLPVDEICDDEIDNDCDGQVDDDDADCGREPRVGDACADDDVCAPDWRCLGLEGRPGEAVFVGGYCGRSDCQGDCGVGASCVRVFGTDYCLERCEASEDCRPGYDCLVVGVRQVCVPRCADDADCADPQRPVCELSTGQCETMQAVTRRDAGRPAPSMADAGPSPGALDAGPPSAVRDGGPDVLFGTDEGDGLVAEGCRCDVGRSDVGRSGVVSVWWLLLAFAGLASHRRRRHRRRRAIVSSSQR